MLVSKKIEDIIRLATGGSRPRELETIQSLWSGYGSIKRYAIAEGKQKTVIVKHIAPERGGLHPRGWNSDVSHQRKLKSYQVERQWYEHWARRATAACSLPHCYAVETIGDELLIVLEDMDAIGFAARREHVSTADLKNCLSWLAHFHACYMGEKPEGLWKQGSYWHLATRQDELVAMPSGVLKAHAGELDRLLEDCPYKTLIHGDAKLANFCFDDEKGRVCAVDFQYVGAGCGMKDVAYFISSCLDEDACEEAEAWLLDYYFQCLHQALSPSTYDADAIEKAWRPLYDVAWTDFFRFLQGWHPGHWKIHRYSADKAAKVLEQLKG